MSVKNLKPEYISHYINDGGTYSWVNHQAKILPSTYLEYARQDFDEQDGGRALINAVGNAKRAFHLQTETLCDALGWKVAYKNRQLGFDKRLEYLSKCGVLSPRILFRLNKTRNRVEHEYIVPTTEQVEDYLDIVELFIFAVGQILDRFPYEIDFSLMQDEYYDSTLELPNNFTFNMNSGSLDSFTIGQKGESITKAMTDDDYFPWLKAIFTQYFLV